MHLFKECSILYECMNVDVNEGQRCSYNLFTIDTYSSMLEPNET